jgi:hypothetical protein
MTDPRKKERKAMNKNKKKKKKQQNKTRFTFSPTVGDIIQQR